MIDLDYEPTARAAPSASGGAWWRRLLRRVFRPSPFLLDGRVEEISPRDRAEITRLLDNLPHQEKHS